MLKILGRANSLNVQKVMWAVGELGLAHERIDMGGAFGGLDTPAYGALNPNRKVPVLQDGDVSIWESNAIVRYLGARYGQGSLWPTDPGERSKADRWMDWILNSIMPDLTIAFWQTIRTAEDKRDHVAVAGAAERLGPIWALLDRHLADSGQVGGTELTVGDIPAGVAFNRYVQLPIARPELPACARWLDGLKQRRPFQEHVMIPLT